MAARHAPQPTPTTNHVNGSGAGGGGGGSRDGVVVRVRPASTALASNGAAPPPPRSTGLTVLLSAPYAFPHASRYAEVLAAFGIDTLRVGPGVERLEEDQLLNEYAGRFDAAIVGDDRFTPAVFAACSPRLRALAKWGTGVDSLDAAAAAEHSVAITRMPGAFTHPVADSSVAFVLALARGVPGLGFSAGGWPKTNGVSLCESTVGIVGLGDVGKAVAHRLLAFGATVLAVDPVAPPNAWLSAHPGVRLATSFHAMLPSVDFLVLCADLNATSARILDADALARMRPSACVVNAARGGLVHEQALIDALQSGRLAGAGLDVFEHEPLPASSPLRTLPNVLLTAHNANSSPEAHARVHTQTVTNLLDSLNIAYERF